MLKGNSTVAGLLAVVLLAGCGGSGGSGDDAAPPAPSPAPPPPPPPTGSGLDARPSNTSCIAPDPTPAPATGIRVTRVYPALSFASPVLALQAPGDDSRWFVVEQAGRIRVFDNVSNVAASSLVLDIASKVEVDGERGLLGMAFDPQFAQNDRVFLYYSRRVGTQLQSVLAAYTSPDGGSTLDPGSEQILLTVNQPHANHNGGHLAFGRTGCCTCRSGTAVEPPILMRTRRTAPRCSARSCGSTSRVAPTTQSRPATAGPVTPAALPARVLSGRSAPRSTPTGSETRGGTASIRRRATCGSATSDSTPGKKSTASWRAATTAGISARARIASNPRAVARRRVAVIR